MFEMLDFLEGDTSLDDAPELGGEGSLEFPDLALPDSRTYGEIEDLRLFIRRASCSFSSSSISTSFISSPTPSSGDIFLASINIFTPKTRKSAAARKFVSHFGIRVGTAWPRSAERTVMVIRALKAAEKTIHLSWRIAISAAIRKVLSPISENIIMVKARKRECSGWMTALSSSGACVFGAGFSESGMKVLSLGDEGFSGSGIS